LLSGKGGLKSPVTGHRKSQKARAWFKGIKTWFLSRITVGLISKLTGFMLFALVLSAIITFLEGGQFRKAVWGQDLTSLRWFLIAFHVVLPFILIVVTALGLYMYKRKKRELIEKLRDLIPKWERKPGKYINKLRVSDLIEMGILRAGSTAALTSAIYMDRIRGLGYSTAFSREDLKNKILANEIFALLEERDPNDGFHRMLNEQNAWPPPAQLLRIVETAANMPTKLWIDSKPDDELNDLDYLVVCGQATICYNLMKYLWEELREDDGTWLDPKMIAVFDHAMVEWKKLMADPLSLLKDRKRKSRLPEQNEHARKLEAVQS